MNYVSKTPLIVSCSARKRSSHIEKTEFHKLAPKTRLQTVAADWLTSLNQAKNRQSAIDVYVGGAWPALKDLAARGMPIYICSAGYGLLSHDELISCYDATFSPKDVNYIGKKIPSDSTLSDWVSVIVEQRSKASRLDFVDLFRANRIVILALPLPYLAAFWPVIESALKANPDVTLFVFCPSKFRPAIEYGYNVIFTHLDERWRIHLNCTRSTLATEAAIFVLTYFQDLNEESLRKFEENLELPPPSVLKTKLTDEQVLELLRNGWRSGDIPRQCSKALNYIRNTLHYSCEQSRFAALVRDLKESETFDD